MPPPNCSPALQPMSSLPPMPRRYLPHLALFVLILIADLVSKHWVESPGFATMVLIPDWLGFVRAHNSGVAFSLFAELPESWRVLFLIGMTLAIAAFVGWWWWQERNTPGLTHWLLTMILAGAAGNLWDRIQLGYVVDFISVRLHFGDFIYDYPVFNIADCFISVPVVLLLLLNLRRK